MLTLRSRRPRIISLTAGFLLLVLPSRSSGEPLSGEGSFQETALTPSSWRVMGEFTTTPRGRAYHDAIYDALRDRMVVFGGFVPSLDLTNDVWELPFGEDQDWIQVLAAGTPPPKRAFHTTVYDPNRQRMIVFGGGGGSGMNDVWALSLSGSPEWTPLTPSGTPPHTRNLHAAIFDPAGDRMVVFGGSGDQYYADVWELSFECGPAWKEITPVGSGPTGRTGHAAAYDWIRRRMLVFGGFDGAYRNDVWALSLAGSPAWTHIAPTGTPPNTRGGARGVYDPVRDCFLIFGGYPYSNDVWAVSLSGSPAWAQVLPDGSPPPHRYFASTVFDPLRERMVVFGGEGPDENWENLTYFNDTWELIWGSTVGTDSIGRAPGVAVLQRVFPNPTNGDHFFELAIGSGNSARHLQILDSRGRLLWSTSLSHFGAGRHSIRWDGRSRDGASVGPGVFFVRLLKEGAPEQNRIVRLP